ncbi:hypothetical protein MED222_05765 [Vibrio sp. MED222]|nr:hypothetical protein MED222_05765 [Vibrio sp. MED222]
MTHPIVILFKSTSSHSTLKRHHLLIRELCGKQFVFISGCWVWFTLAYLG